MMRELGVVIGVVALAGLTSAQTGLSVADQNETIGNISGVSRVDGRSFIGRGH